MKYALFLVTLVLGVASFIYVTAPNTTPLLFITAVFALPQLLASMPWGLDATAGAAAEPEEEEEGRPMGFTAKIE